MLRSALTDAGAVVLQREYVELEMHGVPLRIGGYMGYYATPTMTSMDPEKQAVELAFYEDFENTDRVKLLLDHIPTSWLDWHWMDRCDVDLVFCGHYHGGQVVIPFLNQGLYAPYVGWWPEYLRGVFEGELATVCLSAGLGGAYRGVPRLFNPPELVCMELV